MGTLPSQVNAEAPKGQGQRVHHSAVPPDPDLHVLTCGMWHHVDVDVHSQGYVGHRDVVAE